MPRSAKNGAGSATPASRQEKRKKVKGIVLLISFGLLLVCAGALLYWLNHQLFEHNRRFTLRRVEIGDNIGGNGYWSKTEQSRKELSRFVDLRPGAQNLFEISTSKVQSKLKSIANVADARVERVLPDTIRIHLEERVACAFIGYSDSDLVVDEKGMVMNKYQCIGVHKSLPYVTGVRQKVIPGVPLSSTAAALEVIMQVNRAFPNFQIDFVSIQTPDELKIGLKADKKQYVVTMPQQNIPRKLDELSASIQYCREHNVDSRRIDLTTDNESVIKK